MEDISRLVQELNQKIEDKRDVIEPLLTKVRPLRTKHQNLQNEMKEAKRKYDSVLAGIESGRGNLEREVAKIRKEHTQGMFLIFTYRSGDSLVRKSDWFKLNPAFSAFIIRKCVG